MAIEIRSMKVDVKHKAIVKHFSRRWLKSLAAFGADVRAIAQRSIRDAAPGESSPAGHPPFSHTGLLKKFIVFSIDRRSMSVIIGPALFDSPNPYGSRFRGKTIPEGLEKGGTLVTRINGRMTTVPMAPRPYMGPALKLAIRRAHANRGFFRK